MTSRFSKQADLYARYRPDYPTELYDFIFKHLKRKDTAWDCGTGSGQVAAVLAEHFDTVYASDISSEQMEHAPRKSNINYYQVPAEDTGFPPLRFDLITVAQAIHWFDFKKFYAEVRRTANEDGLLAAFGYGYMSINPAIDELTHRFYEDMFGRYFSETRHHLDERYRSIPFPFEEIPSPDFEKKFQWSFEYFKGFLNSWSPVQQYKDDHGSNPVDPLLEKLEAVWKPGESRTVTFPVFLRLGKIH